MEDGYTSNANSGWTGSQIVITVILFLFTIIGGLIACLVFSNMHQKEGNDERRHQEQMELKKLELGISGKHQQNINNHESKHVSTHDSLSAKK